MIYKYLTVSVIFLLTPLVSFAAPYTFTFQEYYDLIDILNYEVMQNPTSFTLSSEKPIKIIQKLVDRSEQRTEIKMVKIKNKDYTPPEYTSKRTDLFTKLKTYFMI